MTRLLLSGVVVVVVLVLVVLCNGAKCVEL